MYAFGKKELWALAGLTFLLILALLHNLGIVPLYAEEPRRATVALEMLLRGNWIVPTINGEIYQLKPPVFNWIIASIYQITDNPSEFHTRLTTVFSLLILGVIIFWAGRKYVSTSFGALSAFLFATASGNLFFNSLLAEIDMFYSMITYAGLISLFHFYQRKKFFALFLIVYFLGAVGTLTKGLPSLLFTGLSILVFFSVNRDFRKLFTIAHYTGILLYLLIVGGYFVAYSRYGGDAVSYLLNLSVESGKRFSGDTFWDYLQHMVLYPLDTLMNLLPASILLIFAFRRSFLADIRLNPLMKFALLMLVVHFPVYWLPPGGRQRYIIMLYPFIVQIITYFYLIYFTSEKRTFRILSITIGVTILLLAIGSLVPFFLNQLEIPNLFLICLSAFLLLGLIGFYQLKRPKHTIISLIFALIVLRFLFGFIVLPVRATEGKAPENRDAALKIAGMTEGQQVNILHPTYFPMQSVLYFEKERKEILHISKKVKPGQFYILSKSILHDYSFYRETNTLTLNPLKPKSDPYSRDNIKPLSLYPFKTMLEFRLQKKNYLLILPE